MVLCPLIIFLENVFLNKVLLMMIYNGLIIILNSLIFLKIPVFILSSVNVSRCGPLNSLLGFWLVCKPVRGAETKVGEPVFKAI